MDNKLGRIMSKIFRVMLEEITPKSSMDNLEAWDSLGHLSLIITIEEEFQFSLSEDEILNMISYADIKQILSNRGLDI